MKEARRRFKQVPLAVTASSTCTCMAMCSVHVYGLKNDNKVVNLNL